MTRQNTSAIKNDIMNCCNVLYMLVDIYKHLWFFCMLIIHMHVFGVVFYLHKCECDVENIYFAILWSLTLPFLHLLHFFVFVFVFLFLFIPHFHSILFSILIPFPSIMTCTIHLSKLHHFLTVLTLSEVNIQLQWKGIKHTHINKWPVDNQGGRFFWEKIISLQFSRKK